MDTCGHPASAEVEADAGEVVCSACGVVKYGAGIDEGGSPAATAGAREGGGNGSAATAAQHATHAPQQHWGQPGNRPNLYLEMEVGGKPDRTLRGDKYVHRQTDLAVVSNIAQKLGVRNNVGQSVWAWYQRLRKELGLTKSKCLVLSFYGVCRSMGCPLVESKLLECIRMELGVRNAHPYLRVIMDASRHMCPAPDGRGREMVLRRCGFLDLVEGGGEDTIRFAMGCELQSLAGQYEAEIISRIAGAAKRLLPVLSEREQNPRRAARMAVRMARRKVCGHAGVSR